MEFTVENFEKVVTEFYRIQNELNRDCHEWLQACQRSREAWHIVWPLMDTTKPLHTQFVSANTLQYKITRCMNEVPETDLMLLKENLISTLARYIANTGLPVIITRLQISLAGLIISTIGPIWPNPLEDLGAVFSPQNFPGVSEDYVLKLLIQTYAHIPEQTQSMWQHSSRKGETYRAIQDKGESMFSWLFKILQIQQNPEVIKEALKAMSAWLKMFSLCEWSEINALVTSLVALCSKAFVEGEDRLCELSLDIITAIVTEPSTHQYPNLILMVLGKIIPLQTKLDAALDRADKEMTCAFYGTFVSLADSHSKLIVEVLDEESTYNKSSQEHRTNALALVDILLKCTGLPGYFPCDEVVSTLTITVWYSFVEDIQALQAENLKYVRLMKVFEWVFKMLAETLVRKARFPMNDSGWTPDEKEQFRNYRQDLGDCFTYCFDLRGWTMLNELIELAENNLKIVELDNSQYSQLWTELEALLMGIRVVTENISDETDPLVVDPMKRVFEVLFRVLKLNQQIPIPKVFQAAVECISACSGMLQSYDTVAKNLLGYILDGLFLPDVASTATLALKSLSRECAKQLSEFAPQILSSCKRALDGNTLSQNDCIRLVYCVGKFLPYLPPDQVLNGVSEIFSPSLQILHTISTQEPNQQIKPQLVTILNIMSTLCSSLDSCDSDDDEYDDFEGSTNNNDSSQPNQTQHSSQTQPLIPVVEQILPVLVPVTEKWAKHEDVMDALFSILKHTMSTIQTASPAVIEYGMQLILISFRISPSAPATALAKQILLMLGPENVQAQCQLLQQIHPLGCESLKNARDNLDFAESYFNFIGLLVKNNTSLINQSGINFDLMLVAACEIMNYSEVHLLKAGIYFLQIAIDKAAVLNPPLVPHFRTEGFTLVRKILLGIGCIVPRSSVHYFADIFLNLNKILAADWRKWVTDALAPVDFPSQHCTPEAKSKFYIKVTRDRVNRRAMQEAISDFALDCRNLSGSDYAAMTSKRI